MIADKRCLIAFPIARDPPHMELSPSRGQKAVYSKDRRLDRLATNTSTSRPALTPDLKSEIAREMAILEEMSKLSISVQMARAQEPLRPNSLRRLFGTWHFA